MPLKTIPIGKPIANTRIYILDENLNLLPKLVPGELYIGGHGLARGYLNRPELTAEKFIEDPYKPGTKMYKSGDLARWLDDGNLEFLGRIDTQVKIRGYRIETSEIAVQLNQYPDIKNCAVVVHGEENNKQLVAFYVADDSSRKEIVKIPSESLKEHLLRSLPEYMVPSVFISLAVIPLTPNGKVDVRALELMGSEQETSKEFVPPGNQTEKDLADIWSSVLKMEVDKISVHDDFFELGGNSLLAVNLLAKMNRHFDQKLPLAVLFPASNISELASLISGKENKFDILVPIQEKGNKRPIFGIPGSAGSVLYMQPLSDQLGQDQPFYGLQAVGLDAVSKPLDDLIEFAKVNVRAMQKKQKHGPYRLIGHSYGGIVAYEMVKLLQDKGEEVEVLLLLDTAAPTLKIDEEKQAKDEVSRLYDMCLYFANLHHVELELDVEKLYGMKESERNEYIATRMTEQGVDITTEQFTASYNIARASERALENYRPSKLSHDLDIVLFRALEDNETLLAIEDYGWNKLVSKPVRVFDVNGNHLTILDAEYIEAIANRIKSLGL